MSRKFGAAEPKSARGAYLRKLILITVGVGVSIVVLLLVLVPLLVGSSLGLV